jgi:hypothetical protein
LGPVTYHLGGYFVNLVNFTCHAQTSQPVRPAQASSPYFNVELPKAELVDMSSSDTEEALALLSLSPARGCDSPILNLRSSSDSDLLECWLEANGMAVSVYVALTVDASSFRATTVSALHDSRESCADGSSTRHYHSQAASSKKPRWQKTVLTGAPRR